jgi:hypothetical protein
MNIDVDRVAAAARLQRGDAGLLADLTPYGVRQRAVGGLAMTAVVNR